jgi:hypothetical protein
MSQSRNGGRKLKNIVNNHCFEGMKSTIDKAARAETAKHQNIFITDENSLSKPLLPPLRTSRFSGFPRNEWKFFAKPENASLSLINGAMSENGVG